jgi:soluble lytic murein transglycosylase-like protein
MSKLMLLIAAVLVACVVALADPSPAFACRDYDGHRNWVVEPSCGPTNQAPASDAGSSYGSSTGSVDAAIDAVGLPPVFHSIAAAESGGDPYAVNPSSGACGPFQFLPSTAASYGYTCADLTDPYVAAQAALALYHDSGLSPWSASGY